MKNKLVSFLILAIALSIVACSGKDNANTNTDEKQGIEEAEGSDADQAEVSNADNSASYFTFLDDGTTIAGITEDGKKQKVLVIPEQAKSLMGLVLSDSEVEEVSFAADHDVELEAAFTSAAQITKVTLPTELSVISKQQVLK